MSKNFDKNKYKDILEDLTKLGLSDKEALVYSTLLSLGETGSSPIILATGLHGQYVYQSLYSLESKGLVQRVIKKGRNKFSAKDPSVLSELANNQQKIADSLSKRLGEIVILPGGQRFETIQGEESFVSKEFELLRDAPANSTLLIIGGEGDQYFEIMRSRLGEYEKIRLDKKITIRYLGSESQRLSLLKSQETRRLFEFRLLPGLFTGEVNTNIYSNLIFFNIFGDPSTKVVIRDPKVAESYSQFFETLWKLGH